MFYKNPFQSREKQVCYSFPIAAHVDIQFVAYFFPLFTYINIPLFKETLKSKSYYRDINYKYVLTFNIAKDLYRR